MDRSHEGYIDTMQQDPMFDKRKLSTDNYSKRLSQQGLDVSFGHSKSDAYLNDGLKIRMREQLDETDLKWLKEGKIDYIGIKPVVNSNRPLTKEE